MTFLSPKTLAFISYARNSISLPQICIQLKSISKLFQSKSISSNLCALIISPAASLSHTHNCKIVESSREDESERSRFFIQIGKIRRSYCYYVHSSKPPLFNFLLISSAAHFGSEGCLANPNRA